MLECLYVICRFCTMDTVLLISLGTHSKTYITCIIIVKKCLFSPKRNCWLTNIKSGVSCSNTRYLKSMKYALDMRMLCHCVDIMQTSIYYIKMPVLWLCKLPRYLYECSRKPVVSVSTSYSRKPNPWRKGRFLHFTFRTNDLRHRNNHEIT